VEPAQEDRSVRYALSWPAWLAERAAQAASQRTMPLSAWIRQAVLEKLERDKVNSVGRLPE
jgi:hypothetical protein